MKKILSIIAIAAASFAGSLSAHAQEMVTVLTVNLQDGTTERYKLTESPTVKMENHKIVVASASLQGEYDFENVSHFSFDKQPEEIGGVDDVAGDDAAFEFTYVDNATVTVAAPTLQWVAVYTMSGMEVTTVMAEDNRVTIDVSGLTPGVYIVAPSCHSAIKIVKR